ncbi:hypothetical protein MMC30_001228 [Trapelia coarctata]|nr:hypothetical protein [Trapelia coarctata]
MDGASQSSTNNTALKDLTLNAASSFNESANAANSALDGAGSGQVGVNGLNHNGGDAAPAPVINGIHSLNGHISATEEPVISNPPSFAAEGAEDPAVQQPISAVREEGDPAVAEHPTEAQITAPPEPIQQASGAPTEPMLSFMSEAAPATDDQMDISTSLDPPPQIENVDIPHHPAVPIINDTLPEAPLDPPSTPATQTPLLSPPDQTSGTAANQEMHPSTEDHEMQDAPQSPAKIARSREDEDEEDGRALKRIRAEGDGSQAPEFKIPDLPQTVAEQNEPPSTSAAATDTNAMSTQPTEADTSTSRVPITAAQYKYLIRGVQNLKRTSVATAFKEPVDPVALGIPTYFDFVKNPMDLKTMEEKLKAESYSSVDAFIADFNQIVENCVTFNGHDHPITLNAVTLKAAFDKLMTTLPSPDLVKPPPPAKKAKPAVSSTQQKSVLPRRESRSSLGNAKSPTAAGSPQTFALGPQGVPLIRRDSMATDGRPKREIHPPAPRDLPYSNQKPKKKKFQTELRFCQYVMSEMMKTRYQGIAWPFVAPVDPVALNIPTYHKIIKKPMDLSTIEKKLGEGQYENAKEFEVDMRLMFANCYRFNPASDKVHTLGKEYEAVFDEILTQKKGWIDKQNQASGQQSPGSSPDSDDEDEEEEEEEEEDNDEISKLKDQIAAMSKQVAMIEKKKASPPATTKKGPKTGKAGKPAPKKGGAAVPVKNERKDPKPTKKTTKTPYVTYEQKQDISGRINTLPENRMATALNIIRENMPNLKGVQEDEIELDIDELSNEVLYKLLNFVRKYAPLPTDPPPRPSANNSSTAPSRPKKNKPMSKVEQEAKIQEIKGRLSGFQNNASDVSPEPYGQHASPDETSGDEDDSEESEED